MLTDFAMELDKDIIPEGDDELVDALYRKHHSEDMTRPVREPGTVLFQDENKEKMP